jgi:hypothetical protein
MRKEPVLAVISHQPTITQAALLMSTQIPLPSNAVNLLPDGVVTGSRKRKQAFSLNDPDNIELARLATQAAKKNAKLSKLNLSEKKTTNRESGSKSNRQPSVEEVDDADNTRHHVFPRNPKNIIESSEDNDEPATIEATKKKANPSASKPNPSQNMTNKTVQKQNRQLSVVDVDESDNDLDDNLNGVLDRVDPDDEDEILEVEQPVESEEAELSQYFNNEIVLFTYPMQSALNVAGVHLFMHSLIQSRKSSTSMDDEHMSSCVLQRLARPRGDLRDV